MSLSVDGVWKSGVWTQTAWAAGVWREGSVAVEAPRPIGGTRRQLADRDKRDDDIVADIERALAEPKKVEPKRGAPPPRPAPEPERFSPLDPLEPSTELTAMAFAMRRAEERQALALGKAVKDISDEEAVMLLLLMA